MRILIAHKYLFRGGGTNSYVLTLMSRLEALGHEVVPFAVAYAGTQPSSYSEHFVSPPAGANAVRLRDMRLSPLTMLKLLGRATYSVQAYRKARRLVDMTQPDIAYVNNIYNYMSPSILRAFKRRALPVVMRVADFNLLCPELHFLRRGEPCTECLQFGFKRALRYRCLKGSFLATAGRVFSMYVHQWLKLYDLVDVFVTPAKFTKDMLVRAGYRCDQVVHIPSFVDVQEDAVAEERDYLLYSGRVAPEKGIATLIEALSLVGGDTRLIIAGGDRDGEEKRLRELAGRFGVRRVEFVGHQQPAELQRLLGECLFTVVPSLCYDNAPLSVLESFVQGKPVIGSNIGGIPEQITPECGLLFQPGNASDLAQKIHTLLASPALRRRMGQAARQRVREHFSAEKHCARLLALLGGLLDGRTAAERRRPMR